MGWKDHYKAALVEINPARLLALIHETEAAMSLRSHTLPAVTTPELQEMNDASYTLAILRKASAGRISLGSHKKPRGAALNTAFPWQQIYMDAVLETDDLKLSQLLEAADSAITARRLELAQEHQATQEERQAISAAVDGLDTLRKERIATAATSFSLRTDPAGAQVTNAMVIPRKNSRRGNRKPSNGATRANQNSG